MRTYCEKRNIKEEVECNDLCLFFFSTDYNFSSYFLSPSTKPIIYNKVTFSCVISITPLYTHGQNQKKNHIDSLETLNLFQFQTEGTNKKMEYRGNSHET